MVEESKILELIEVARDSGKIRKGANEATKAIEKGQAKLVVYAADVSPKEIVMHLPLLCKDKNVACTEVKTKEALGAAAGLGVGTAAVAIVKEGEGKSGVEAAVKELMANQEPKEEAEEKKEEPAKEEKPEPEKKEESVEEKKEESPKEEAPAEKAE
ncbi:MAG: 50S ribosomal protein L7ae [Parcubacteria group bacterium]|nr:50S ribosomal protein L7ae [Parcubacteria group bacterium]|tara:strand:- start:1478 stop:1948 length:471 start_codon:yes stop_codon:yes gene_type:complete